MKTVFRSFFVAGLLAASSLASQAADRGTPDEAQAMLKKAVTYLKAHGNDKSFTEFNDAANKEFHDRDLYVFAIDPNGVTLANGGNPRLVGKNVSELKDADGVAFVKEYLAIGKAGRKGNVNFKFLNPMTKAIEPKVACVEWVGDVMLGSGAYKP